jgi:hypothetical protein
MQRLLNWLWNRAVLFALLVAAALILALAGPYLPQAQQIWAEDIRDPVDFQAGAQGFLASQQAELERRTTEAGTLTADQLRQRIAALQANLAAARGRQEAAGSGLFAAYRPSQIAARTKAEIEIAAIESELAVLRAALAPRETLEKAQTYLEAHPTMPTEAAIAAAKAQCAAARREHSAFQQRWKIDQGLRETFQLERTELEDAEREKCRKASDLADKRAKAIAWDRQHKTAQQALAAAPAQAQALPQSLASTAGHITLRDILWQAGSWLLLITLAPFAYRTIAYFVLAPIAASRPPMRFAGSGAAPPQPVASPSAISQAITFGGHDEVLVRQDYLQSSSLAARKGFRWLLDWRRPLTSLASGMRFLTAISGAGERITVSAVKDPFAELSVLTLPQGAACILRPSALAAVVQPQGAPLRIISHWRIFSLPALLTWQWRYLAFHGPARLVVKGGRGVRIEPAMRGRIVGEGQMLGFSTDLAYAVIRSETFWPYFFGREALLKDRVEAGGGVLLIEEAPLAGKSGIRRGIEGLADAALKLVGI